jgi:hypothetical protein
MAPIAYPRKDGGFRRDLRIDATRTTRLKTGAYELKAKKHRGRVEFFALPMIRFAVAD